MRIIWFRRDLRLTDNECVAEASANDAPVLPCFIIDPWFYQKWTDVGKARVRFLFESLENLDQNLRSLGSHLYLFEGDSVNIVQEMTQQLMQQGHKPKLYFNRDVQVEYGIERDSEALLLSADRTIVNFYQQLNLDYHIGLNNFVQIDDDHRDQWFNEYYTYVRQTSHPTPIHINTPQISFNLPQLSFTELKHKYHAFYETKKVYFKGGETQAQKTLDSFLTKRFYGYHWKLSRPWAAQQKATSHLSPHLTFGTISVRNVYQRTKARAAELADTPKAEFSLKAFRDRLRWHDSFTQRLYFHPEIAHTNFYPEFDEYYQPDELTPQQQELFHAWQEGITGFPMLDASMRQLKTMGWMNFRMRAMCATFLTINCGISWHHGAKHYMNCLVDGDLAINNWQWQMQAGITNPLSDTFRIYNPNKNIEEKDSDLRFIYHWIPKLLGYSLSEILEGKYIEHGLYPSPILDWAQTRLVNGKIVSDIRKRVKQRLLIEGGKECENALATKTAVNKYVESKDKQYQQFKKLESQLGQ
ncbi:deoxyribodipyrimidine photo-lyase [Brasilonema octagenarum UFV-E1]|uniref:Deoxyribodipyrimidine photo-lyase n=1 Tax=Brasilonema sennae CENA114 TaxID=415709 RepID=A0A856MPJ4_9CYAN|nr:FAD-binding domain-containing protein [Brasilonema sennae]QDL12020.1 deoxyribodipyrimidine photo-lyase [Brasilonema sennae CENA114]QDL18395.1 deoxyribodipyrimidine photo-lyase [Brasilonema octagenarum UFV-E1]